MTFYLDFEVTPLIDAEYLRRDKDIVTIEYQQGLRTILKGVTSNDLE